VDENEKPRRLKFGRAKDDRGSQYLISYNVKNPDSDSAVEAKFFGGASQLIAACLK
jgi:hypothetical protein